MTRDPALPPHLERFVRDQLAAGGFRSEGELVRAAVQLLAASALAGRPAAPPPDGTGAGLSRRPVPSALTERWDPVGSVPTPPPARRSPRGLLADLRSDLTFDDLADVRAETWDGHRPGGDR